MNTIILKYKKPVAVGAIVLVCALLAGVRWVVTYSSGASGDAGSSKEAAERLGSAVPAVRAFVCAKKQFVDNLVMTGTLQGGARVELRFKREGQISQLNYRVGDKVKKGDRIAALDVGEARIKRQQSEAELSQAVDLYKSGAIAKPRLTQARLAAQLARKEFNHSFIKASRDGSIGELNVEEGEFVTPQVTAATLVSLDKVFVEMGVIEKDLSKLHLNQTVQVEVETYPDVTFEGKIARISPLVEGTSRTRTVRAEIKNDQGLLLPGMFAQTKIFIMEKPDMLVVPATAIKTVSRDGKKDKHMVFVLSKGNRVQEKDVKVGYESADYSEIVSGLEPEMKIVERISDQIRKGIQVDVVEEVAYEPR